MSTFETAGLFTQQPSQHGDSGARVYVQFWQARFTDARGQRRTVRYPVPVKWALVGADLCDNAETIRRNSRDWAWKAIDCLGAEFPADNHGVNPSLLALTTDPDGPRTGRKFDWMHWRDQVTEL